jgi:hypothetical protein
VRVFTGLLEKLYRVHAKYRCASIVVRAAALAPLSLGASEPALAQCIAAGGNLTCSGAFNSNINLNGGPSQALSILLNPGVSVTSPGGGAVNAR